MSLYAAYATGALVFGAYVFMTLQDEGVKPRHCVALAIVWPAAALYIITQRIGR